jgi:hypothetical protein
MGWSCSREAGKTMDRWADACFKQTGSSNTYLHKGEKRFWEQSRTEHADGAITGKVFEFVGETSAVFVGSFRIEGNGDVTRGPKL